MKRREALSTMALASGASIINSKEQDSLIKKPISKRINHSVCQWCYGRTPLEELVDRVKDIGIQSIELLGPDQWDTVLSRDVEVAIGYGTSIGLDRGFNDISLHGQLQSDYKKAIPEIAKRGIKQVICFSGNRNGLSDEQGLENCAVGLEPVVKMAKEYGITVIMELLNSKVDHKDYKCDRTNWGVALANKIGSEHFKLLYDIYHMQVMEGDVIATIREYKDYINHFHTGGVPGRNEINESQELYYPAIMKAIADLEFEGYVAQEFIPTRKDPFISLAEGITICDI